MKSPSSAGSHKEGGKEEERKRKFQSYNESLKAMIPLEETSHLSEGNHKKGNETLIFGNSFAPGKHQATDTGGDRKCNPGKGEDRKCNPGKGEDRKYATDTGEDRKYARGREYSSVLPK